MSSWSFSAYSTALQCLRKYKYIYVDKLMPEGPESGDLLFGSALHSAINASLLGDNGEALFEIYWMAYKDKEIEYGRFKWKELAELGANFIRKFVKYHSPKYKLEFAEKRLFSEYRGIRLEGTLDFYGLYNGLRSLRDFKTSGRNYEAEKSDCATQLYLYSYLYLANNPAAGIDTLGYTVFNKGTGSIQDLTWKFDENKMLEVLDELVSYTKHLTATEEYPKNFQSCLDYSRKCPYYDLCHKGEKNE